MLLMVIEHFKDTDKIGDRFQKQGRMLPDGVVYHSSWIDPTRNRCFQVMEAASTESLKPWTERWDDLVEFEVFPVVSSAEFWKDR